LNHDGQCGTYPVDHYLPAATIGENSLAQYTVVEMMLARKALQASAAASNAGKAPGEDDDSTNAALVLDLLQRSAASGFPPAATKLGMVFLNGGLGYFPVTKNQLKGKQLLDSAAKSSQPKALLELGRLSLVNRELGQARKLLVQCLDLTDDAEAAFLLGMVAAQEGNFAEAKQWFEHASTPAAFMKLASVEAQLGETDKNSPSVLRWVAKAAYLGEKQACSFFFSGEFASGNIKFVPEPKVFLNCLAIHGSAAWFEHYLVQVFPKLKDKDKLRATLAVRQVIADKFPVERRPLAVQLARKNGMKL